MTLQNKLIISFILFILLPLFGTGIYAYSEFEKMLREQAAVSAADRLHQVNLNMERKLSAMMNVSNAIVLDNDVRKILKNPPVSPRKSLMPLLSSIKSIWRSIRRFFPTKFSFP